MLSHGRARPHMHIVTSTSLTDPLHTLPLTMHYASALPRVQVLVGDEQPSFSSFITFLRSERASRQLAVSEAAYFVFMCGESRA